VIAQASYPLPPQIAKNPQLSGLSAKNMNPMYTTHQDFKHITRKRKCPYRSADNGHLTKETERVSFNYYIIKKQNAHPFECAFYGRIAPGVIDSPMHPPKLYTCNKESIKYSGKVTNPIRGCVGESKKISPPFLPLL
jgi:hypothetical protein